MDEIYIAEAASKRHGLPSGTSPESGSRPQAHGIRGAADSGKGHGSHRLPRRAGWAAAAAACLAVLLLTAAGLRLTARNGSLIELSDASINVTARYADPKEGQAVSSAACLIELTEEEIFHQYNTLIFRGTVTSIRNIELNYNGLKMYQSIAEIRVSRVYRGDCRPGETLKVLLPCPIMEGYAVTATDVSAATRTGTEGIFMPVRYDASYICSMNGATLQYADIADYGFLDGQRWAFLNTSEGLVFDRSYQYQNLEDAQSLDDIELYIEKMLGP